VVAFFDDLRSQRHGWGSFIDVVPLSSSVSVGEPASRLRVPEATNDADMAIVESRSHRHMCKCNSGLLCESEEVNNAREL